jgi:hypothetical protein
MNQLDLQQQHRVPGAMGTTEELIDQAPECMKKGVQNPKMHK